MWAIELIEDTKTGSGSEIVPDQLASIGLDGIDLLANAILFGGAEQEARRNSKWRYVKRWKGCQGLEAKRSF